jgi:hypothetical protein
LAAQSHEWFTRTTWTILRLRSYLKKPTIMASFSFRARDPNGLRTETAWRFWCTRDPCQLWCLISHTSILGICVNQFPNKRKLVDPQSWCFVIMSSSTDPTKHSIVLESDQSKIYAAITR